ncbi:virulence protein RhuM/Fic/DOC family protein [Patescibacteria group bacterium]|nr:virulence protein RhuM/Fic/DOC family protein [Patescibacteria group bacterium]
MLQKDQKKFNKGEIVIYKPSKNKVELKVRFENETVWLDAHQMARIFDVNRPAIVKHILNIYKTGELEKKSTCSILEQVAIDKKVRKMNLYNLDMIISVGYRVNSQSATQFRIWSTKVLKSHLLQGYTINEKRLLEKRNELNKLQQTICFLQKKSKAKLLEGQGKEILNLLADYSKTLSLLEKYDKGKLKIRKGEKARFVLEYKNCLDIIFELRKNLITKKEAGDIFGVERGGVFEGIVNNLYQTFGGKELYKSIEVKASHLLYLTIKDHPFTDGNKRTASFLFVYFLDKNNYLYRESGEKKINDNALTILALLIAESDPKEKEQMVALISQLIK